MNTSNKNDFVPYVSKCCEDVPICSRDFYKVGPQTSCFLLFSPIFLYGSNINLVKL